jgi:hypothetical protein
MLAGTLESMTQVQKVFGFELAALSIPINAWDLKTKSPDGTPYLRAEKLASQLKGTMPDLRVDALVCMTRHWLRDDETLNIFSWWGGKNIPVVIFSCAGFDDLEPAGFITDRVISNIIVSTLAGYFGKIGSHSNGARSCPMFYNPNRELKHLAAHQKFDPHCRAILKKKLPAELPALEALLNVFI